MRKSYTMIKKIKKGSRLLEPIKFEPTGHYAELTEEQKKRGKEGIEFMLERQRKWEEQEIQRRQKN